MSNTKANESNVNIDSLSKTPSPPDFFAKYIQKRKPVVIRDGLKDFPGSLDTLTLDRLRDLIPAETTVQVNELRNQTHNNNSFSPADSNVVSIPFSVFLDQLSTGRYYLTTQTLPLSDDYEDRPAIFTSPVKELIETTNSETKKKYMELRPALLGNLIPMTYNLWIGHTAKTTSCTTTTTSTSSGWHHDYHDNLYILLQGTKTFHLAPPQSITNKLETVGELHKLHDNGRIVYKEQIMISEQDGGGGGEIRADGALEKVERIMELEDEKQDIEDKLLLVNNDDSIPLDDETKRAELEARLDEIEEELLDIECNKNQDVDDDDGSDHHDLLFGGGGVQLEKEEESSSDSEQSKKEEDETDEPAAKKARAEKEPVLPLNFVTDMKDITPQSITLHAGDLFYLPSGWFHNVESGGGTHMALNYWMHPNDGESFDKPYKSKYWQRDWDSRGLL